MKKLVVFASGSGTNFQQIIQSVNSGEIPAEIAGLITNNPEAGALDRAKKADIPTLVLSNKESREQSSEMKQILEKWVPDLIVLAGYLKKIPASIIEQYPDKIINIHPALLPKFGGKGFYGMNVHRAVIDAGESESGCTVHYVNEHYDDGAIIAQKKVPVTENDTPESLAKKVLEQEHKLYPEVIRKLLTQN